ncbi:hypothetical protein [Spirosoma montaniterrae]|uniref:Uncharacterized protein n=1 Tax=Spirosoma montaniterrae TaxID=1178516 RepID=A0A1P9WUG5_9BACT|nr:hypothetical protein [Spirosoma montaniterrae]AQG79024.1 hypothetical protein AWR27_06610 [Spirosoma montaniterrae]
MNYKIQPIFVSLLILVQTSCTRPTALTAELQPRSLQAVNLEENISRRDELMLAYTLTSYDAKNKPVGVVNGGWGVETVQKGQQLDLSGGTNPAQSIRLELPRNGRMVASLVLIEVDEYARAQQMLEQVRKIHNIVSVPVSLVLTATEVLTPLKYVTAGLWASGVGLKLVDQLDSDDLLGQSSVEVQEADLRRQKKTRMEVPAIFTGQHMKDAYEYRLVYDITLKTVQIRPVRQ